ncbi:MAG: hypothetical protein HYS25_06795 [Ignavibacteriales bacterium]|nr:hypothetical protein [Ignavibacteriales bacterium]
MKQKILLVLIAIFFIVINSCNDDIVGPQLSRRDYVWTVDTLKPFDGAPPFQLWMMSMWGSDTNNIFVGGHSGVVVGTILKYDGQKWKPLDLPSTYAFAEIRQILGFDKNDVFFIGSSDFENPQTGVFIDSSLIYHYNGSTIDIMLEGEGRALYTIAGAKNELYTAGHEKIFFKYDGVNWKKEEFKFYIPPEAKDRWCTSILKRKNGDLWMNYYTSVGAQEIYYAYQLIKRGNDWVKIDSVKRPEERFKWSGKLWETPDGVLYAVGNSLSFFDGTNWCFLLGHETIQCIDGTSSNNIFACGERVFHYNGRDWQEFKELTGKYGEAQAVQCIQGQVFILFSNYSKSFIVRGRLK